MWRSLWGAVSAFFCGDVSIKIMPIKIIVLAEYNPSVLTQKSLQYKKGGHIASRKQQSNSLCIAVNPPPFDKGRAWMPEVERPEALHGRKANRAFIWQEYSAWQGIVWSGGHGGVM